MSVDAAVVVAAAGVAAAAAVHSNGGMTYCREAMIHRVQARESVQGSSWMCQHYCRTRGDQCVTVVANELLYASRAHVHVCLGHVQVRQAGRSMNVSAECFVHGE